MSIWGRLAVAVVRRYIGLDLFAARLDLLAGFIAGLVHGILQLFDLLLQGVNVLSQLVRLTNGGQRAPSRRPALLAGHRDGSAGGLRR